jgi:prepilin-type N-terminal cleavage/methylation domain-containing protein
MRRAARGFTLLEVLLAIGIVSIIAGSLYASLYIGFKAQRSATAAVAPVRIAALTLEMIRQDVEGALPPNGVLVGPFTGVYSAEFASLGFFSAANVPAPGEFASDLRHVELLVDTAVDDGKPALYRRVTTNLLPSSETLSRDQVLCRNVTQFSLRYFDGTEWSDSWDSVAYDNQLPLAIEVTLEFNYIADSLRGDERLYRIRRVMAVPCGRTAQQATEAPQQ